MRLQWNTFPHLKEQNLKPWGECFLTIFLKQSFICMYLTVHRGAIKEEKCELVIPLKDSVPLWQRKLIAKKRETNVNKNKTENGIKLEPGSLDALAAEEIIRGTQFIIIKNIFIKYTFIFQRLLKKWLRKKKKTSSTQFP